AGDHELDQRVEERTLAMHGIEAFGFLARQVLHLRGDDPETGLLEARVNFADDVLRDRVGLDDGKGALQRHVPVSPWVGCSGERPGDRYNAKSAPIRGLSSHYHAGF